MFLQASVILSTRGGCLPQYMLGYHPPPPREQTLPREQTPPRSRHPPDQTPPRSRHKSRHPRSRHPPGSSRPPPPRSRLRHTVNERPVRILLECILVQSVFTDSSVRRNIAVGSGGARSGRLCRSRKNFPHFPPVHTQKLQKSSAYLRKLSKVIKLRIRSFSC